MKPSYNVVTIDLTVAHTDFPIEGNSPVQSVTVLQVDSPVTVRFGPGAPVVPLNILGQTFDEVCLTEGLFITNAAAAGSLVLFVSYGDFRAGVAL